MQYMYICICDGKQLFDKYKETAYSLYSYHKPPGRIDAKIKCPLKIWNNPEKNGDAWNVFGNLGLRFDSITTKNVN